MMVAREGRNEVVRGREESQVQDQSNVRVSTSTLATWWVRRTSANAEAEALEMESLEDLKK